MNKFSKGYTANILTFLLVKYGVWTGIHFALLAWLRYLDNEGSLSDTWMSVLLIPIGLVNVALLVDGLRSLKNFHWKNLLYAFAAVANFVLYAYISLQMYSQAGAIVN